ncbi:MAG: ADP-ribosylation factor-like protein [Promethearchaeota archaeon]
MVRITNDQKIFIKVLYWGPASGGKTTAVDTLYRICKEQSKDVVPTGNLTKIAMASGSTLYFDRGIFQSKKQSNIFFHCYTVAGQGRFEPLRKKVFVGTDGVIFVADSQRSRLQDNIDSLKELKRVAGDDLIKKIPLLVMLNKRDLEDQDLISEEEWESIMKEEGLVYEQSNELSLWNPIIFETVALYDKSKNIYRIFSEVARRCVLYQVYGGGSAPERTKVKLAKDVPDL